MGTHTPAKRGEVDDTQLEEPVEQNNEAPTNVTPFPNQAVRTEANILDRAEG